MSRRAGFVLLACFVLSGVCMVTGLWLLGRLVKDALL